ncbi:MAG: DUF2268 domain-containing putative Zn-dependent protease [Flavobacteriaceae bacterium]|nr:DUF2268 domain-containing putative Zn-dependent protease [Flavobacteriaceae bacterium]
MTKYLRLLFFLLITGCSENNLDVNVKIERFEDLFFNNSSEDLSLLKDEYSFLFPSQYNNQVWLDKQNDSLQREIFYQVKKRFNDFSKQKKEIESFYFNYKKLDSNYVIPRIITLTTDVDFRKNIILTDSLLLLGLDNYLGTDHYFYDSFPKYISSNFEIDYLIIDIANSYAFNYTNKFKISNYTFIDKLIYEGKLLYFVKMMLPNYSDNQLLKYSDNQFLWAQNNEKEIWINFIENEYLFSSDSQLESRFLNLAPFSKFYLSIDNDSPSMIGKYIGFQIVNAFMQNYNFSINELMELESMYIYNNSKYKP